MQSFGKAMRRGIQNSESTCACARAGACVYVHVHVLCAPRFSLESYGFYRSNAMSSFLVPGAGFARFEAVFSAKKAPILNTFEPLLGPKTLSKIVPKIRRVF